jgi:hypothetical protein
MVENQALAMHPASLCPSRYRAGAVAMSTDRADKAAFAWRPNSRRFAAAIAP